MRWGEANRSLWPDSEFQESLCLRCLHSFCSEYKTSITHRWLRGERLVVRSESGSFSGAVRTSGKHTTSAKRTAKSVGGQRVARVADDFVFFLVT